MWSKTKPWEGIQRNSAFGAGQSFQGAIQLLFRTYLVPSTCPEYPAWPPSDTPEWLRSSTGYVSYLLVDDLDTLKGL